MKRLLLFHLFFLFQAILFSQTCLTSQVDETARKIEKKGFNIAGFNTAKVQSDYPSDLFLLQDQYNEEEYNKYYHKYQTAKNWKKVGGYLNLLGLLQFAVASGLFFADVYGWEVNQTAYLKLYTSSAAFFAVGMPLWIWQNDRVRNNKKAMHKIKSVHLSLGASKNGAGLIVRF